MNVKLGNDLLLHDGAALLTGKRVGILAHQASLLSDGRHIVDALVSQYHVTALFGPEHGLTTYAQDMESVGDSKDAKTGLPVFSLYGKTIASLSPTAEMLKLIDVLVIDLQDIGTRYYTYVWTAALAMKACADAGKQVIICDRPNPLGGEKCEGAPIHKGFESFVGLYNVPVRHSLTIGEICKLVAKREKLNLNMEILRCTGWQRNQSFPDFAKTWVNPSPNMRSYAAALLYPGMCLLEATNLSEGRGTETPFELVGAPYLQSEEMIARLQNLELPGWDATPELFSPTFQKWAREKCQGVRFNITDVQKFQPYLFGLAFLWVTHKLYERKGFAWRKDPYEFVTHIPAIDLLTGSAAFSKRISTRDFAEIVPLAQVDERFLSEREEVLLY